MGRKVYSYRPPVTLQIDPSLQLYDEADRDLDPITYQVLRSRFWHKNLEHEEADMEDLRGRVAVVTGGASGIGRALADRFAAEGMKVALADVEEPALDAAVTELRASGADVIGVRTDVSRVEDVEALAARTLEAFGAVHVVCNNAGVEDGAPFAEIPLETWNWVLGVNIFGVLYGCRTFLPLLVEQNEGHIVNTASLAAFSGWFPTGTPYVVSKFAVLGMSENLHHELAAAGSKVGVSVLCPGVITTRMPWSTRNRPADVPTTFDDHPQRHAVISSIQSLLESGVGMPASEAADHVIRAIREKRFYVLTHPDEARAAVEARLNWMLTNEPAKMGRLRPWSEGVAEEAAR